MILNRIESRLIDRKPGDHRMPKYVRPGIAWTFLALVVLGSVFGVARTRAEKRSAGPSNKHDEASPNPAPARDDAAARAAFLAAAPVFFHPRCMNCHPSGDRPLQGDDSHVHAQNVQRGSDGSGKYAMKCTTCHQEANTDGLHMPPGAAVWKLPPPQMRMVIQGKTPGQFCEQLKDPARNGGKSLEQIIEHVASDKLVGWGWNPGDGRTLPPLSREEFAHDISQWVRNGAACPP
jgi:hypothetical protein